MSGNDHILGWDIGGTKSAAILGTSDGEIIRRVQWPTDETVGPEAMVDRFFDSVKRLVSTDIGIGCLGVSVPGPMNMKLGTVIAPPHLPGWCDVDLSGILRKRLKETLDCDKVSVLHDAAACVLAESLWGGARGMSHAVYLTCGTGFGAGILIDGRILMGPDGESPEIGYTHISDSSPEIIFDGLPRRGISEVYGSGTGIALLANFLFPDDFKVGTSTETIGSLAREGNEKALAVLSESSKRVGQVCVNLAAIFSPQVILIGSLARHLGTDWLIAIQEYFYLNALPSNSKRTKVMPAALGESLQDLSSLAVAVSLLDYSSPQKKLP